MNGDALFSIQDLNFRYDPTHRWIFDCLTAKIPAAAITAVLGPNGVGKTTLLHLLIGLLPVQSGSVHLAGRPLDSFSRRELSRRIGLVPQLEQIPFPFTVSEYISMGRAPHLGMLRAPQREDERRVEQVLDLLDLQALSHRSVQELSGGESQLVRIARSLVQESRVLLLDEPTAHLDLGNKERVLEVLQALVHERITVIFTTHDPNTAFAIADHALLMHEGSALAYGPVNQVLKGDNLTRAYGLPIEVLQVDGRFVVLRQEGES